MQALKNPKSHMRSQSHDAKLEYDKLNLDYMLPGPADTENRSTPGRLTPQLGPDSLSRSASRQELSSKSRKSARVSLLG